jgi:Domain of unknown function (DUF4136)
MGFRRRIMPVVITAALLGGVAACHPGSISDVGETDLVLTFFDSTASFESITTYAMPDTIIWIDDGVANPAIDAEILAAVAAEFVALGYTRIGETSPTPPDVVVFLTVNRTDISYWVPHGWWGYWGWYPGWSPWYPGWGPGYGPGYPWAPGYVGTRSTGTLLVTMLKPGPAEGFEIPAIWAGAINGLLEGSDASIISRLRGLVAQAFDQSPYL